jgi:predicted phage tail protein
MLQIATILILMVAAPLVAIAIEGAVIGGSLVALAGKWFVFFLGLRLLIAGVSQMVKPQLTAQILRIADPNALKIVNELGFANVAMGGLGVLTIFNAAWIVPAAIVLAIFYALAGGKHVLNAQRTSSENWAMWSDLWAAAVLAGWLVVVWMGR